MMTQPPPPQEYPLLEEALSRQRPHILIAQYTGRRRASHSNNVSDTYEHFLALTSKINIAYAEKWGYDYWILRGLPFGGPHLNVSYTVERHVVLGQRQEIPLPSSDAAVEEEEEFHSFSRATYNKLTLLQLALQNEESFDGLVLLDADAMMYDFSRDIADLLSPHSVLVAHKTSPNSTSGSINVGVTLWNLRHPLAPLVYQRWRDGCVHRILHQPHKLDDDQAPLQHILKHELDSARRDRVVTALAGPEFHYASATFVRHFIRPAGSTWRGNDHHCNSTACDGGDRLRLEKMQRSIAEVCARYEGVCDDDDANH
jgi:hypothetical protein